MTHANDIAGYFEKRIFTMAATTAVRPKRVGYVAEVPKIMRQGRIAPWLYLGPALIVMITFIIYPGLNTLFLSFRNVNGTDWATASCATGEPCWGIFEN